MGVVSAVLVWAGVAVAAGTALRLLLVRDTMTRLHYIAPGTALAAPLVITGLALATWSSWHDVVKLAAIAVLLFGSGPVTVVAAARAARRRRAHE
jgi:multisubunit Na+/H+ antiporter MnhG subunit